MARVNVFLSDDLLRQVDSEAASARMKRSALIQSALSSYLEMRRSQREEEAARREMASAAREMDSLADKLGNWDPTAVIREQRDSRSLGVREPGRRYAAKRGRPRK